MHLLECLYALRAITDRSILPITSTHAGRDTWAEACIAAAQLAGYPFANMENEDDLLAGIRKFVEKRRAYASPVCALDHEWQRATLGILQQLRVEATGSPYLADGTKDELPTIEHGICAIADFVIRAVPATVS